MKSNVILKKIHSKYGINDLIFVSKLYEEDYKYEMTEMSFYKTIERLYKKNELSKVSKGIYAISNITELGEIPVSEDIIINKYITNQREMIVGYNLYNYINLTTQISKNIVIYSSIIDTNIKNVNLKFSDNVREMIEYSEVLKNFNNIEDFNLYQFVKYTESFVNKYNDNILDLVLEKIK